MDRELLRTKTDADLTVLDCQQIQNEEPLREVMEAAVKALKMGKSAGVWIWIFVQRPGQHFFSHVGVDNLRTYQLN